MYLYKNRIIECKFSPFKFVIDYHRLPNNAGRLLWDARAADSKRFINYMKLDLTVFKECFYSIKKPEVHATTKVGGKDTSLFSAFMDKLLKSQ